MRTDRQASIALARSQRPQVARPCEDKRLMQNGKMAHDQLLKHRAALAEAVSKKDKKKAAAIRQTIHAMENSQIYLQYSGCLAAMKTYGASNPMEAARARDRHTRMRTVVANLERNEDIFGLGRKKRTRRHRHSRHRHSRHRHRRHKHSSHKHSRHKRKTKTHRHKKRKSKSTRRR